MKRNDCEVGLEIELGASSTKEHECYTPELMKITIIERTVIVSSAKYFFSSKPWWNFLRCLDGEGVHSNKQNSR